MGCNVPSDALTHSFRLESRVWPSGQAHMARWFLTTQTPLLRFSLLQTSGNTRHGSAQAPVMQNRSLPQLVSSVHGNSAVKINMKFHYKSREEQKVVLKTVNLIPSRFKSSKSTHIFMRLTLIISTKVIAEGANEISIGDRKFCA